MGKKTRGYKKSGLATKSYVKRQIAATTENKWISDALVDDFSSVGSAAWTNKELTEIATGADQGERIGNQIRIKSIEIKGVIAQGSDETALDDPYNVLRVIIAQSTTATPFSVSNPSIDACLRVTNKALLLKKYYDKYIPLQVTSTEKSGGDGYSPGVRSFKFYKKFKKPLVINYSDNTGTSSAKHIVIMMKSDSANVPNPGFVNGYWCLTYEDQ